MDSFKEKDKLALKPSKRPRIEVDEEMVRRIIAGLAPLDSPVVRRIPEPKEEDTDASEENTSETPSEVPGIKNRGIKKCKAKDNQIIIHFSSVPLF